MNLSFSILAGGRGTRMEGLTETTNKTLLIHKGKPIISHIVESLSKYTNKINVVVKYKKEQVIEHLILNFPEIEFKFIEQDNRMGTGGAIELLEDGSDYYFITMGDMIFHQDDLDRFINKFEKTPGNYIMSKKVSNPEKYGVFELDNKKIIGLEEKPVKPKSNLVNLGGYIFDKSIFKFIKQTTPVSNGEVYITDSLKLSLEAGNLFQIYSLENEFSDLTVKEDLE